MTEEKIKSMHEIVNIILRGTKYINKRIVLTICNKITKVKLTKNPFYYNFNYGK